MKEMSMLHSWNNTDRWELKIQGEKQAPVPQCPPKAHKDWTSLTMEQWWNDTGSGKWTVLWEKHPECHSVHQKSHMYWTGIRVEQWWNNDRRKSKKLQQRQFQCHFVHQKYHVDWEAGYWALVQRYWQTKIKAFSATVGPKTEHQQDVPGTKPRILQWLEGSKPHEPRHGAYMQ
jgi:hypothetical protein